jgi:polyphosphate kinase
VGEGAADEDEGREPRRSGDAERALPPRGSDGRFQAVTTPVDVPEDLADPALYLNRELSWLEFNRRVLAQAADAAVPLLERVRFVSIFHTNLDEFFMVRVAGLRRQVQAGVTRRTADGLTPSEQLTAIAHRLRPMLTAASDVLHDQLLPLLGKRGIGVVGIDDLDEAQRDHLDGYFNDEVFPVLTPLAVDPGHPFPYISNLSVSFAVTVRDVKTHPRLFARVKVPGVLPRFLGIPGGPEHTYLPLERLLAANLDRLFPGMEVLGAHLFRVTRNADLDLEEDEADDLLMAIEAELRRRRFGSVVRLEIDEDMPAGTLALLQDELGVRDDDTFATPGLLRLGDLGQLADLDLPELRYPTWHPVVPSRLRAPSEGQEVDLFAEIRERDLLVHHPYDSFTHSVERFITTAADDPDVLAIKQTLYRTSGDSPIVRALIRAAEHGKQVVALVELKARFDEEANIVWARALEKAGVHVVYGLVGLKTHTKTALVVRREAEGLRRYCHVGTGNYNPKTARLYTDLGLLTCDPALGADLTDLFNFLTGYARQDTYRELLVAPVSLRERIEELIQREIDVQAAPADDPASRRGLIRLKLNALIDADLMAKLYRASQAGVQVDLVVRGICGLRPGVPGVSDRINVISIVGQLLEHARVMQFGPDEFWIGSADWMGRNLDRRVEAMAPVKDPLLRAHLNGILDTMLADNITAWRLNPDGSWTRRSPADGEDPRPSQYRFMQSARDADPA